MHAVVVFRQTLVRLEEGKPTKRPAVLFANITYKNCERNLIYMTKYLLNYGFYRFGVEISLIAIVILIASRLDFIAFFYAIWLLAIYSKRRFQKAALWKFLILFSVVMLIYQYAMIVGPLPYFCIDFPWKDSPYLKNFQVLAFLPDYYLKVQIKKLLFDFIVLMILARQSLVFSIEHRIKTTQNEYPGGSNESIVEAVDKQSFSQIDNPTPDFTTNIR